MKVEDAAKLGDSDFAEWVRGAPIEELERVFSHVSFTSHARYWELTKVELSRRRFEMSRKPHWTVTPTFWLVLLGVLLSVVALLVSLIIGWDKIKIWFNNL